MFLEARIVIILALNFVVMGAKTVLVPLNID
jgi:hypothetical protein